MMKKNAVLLLWWLGMATALGFVFRGLVIAHRDPVPTATDLDRAMAPVSISLDGGEWTFRAAADPSIRVCLEAGDRRPCWTVGALRGIPATLGDRGVAFVDLRDPSVRSVCLSRTDGFACYPVR